jgi:hypothetical protein
MGRALGRRAACLASGYRPSGTALSRRAGDRQQAQGQGRTAGARVGAGPAALALVGAPTCGHTPGGMPSPARDRGVRLHERRHTFATLQLSAGVHFMQVSKWLGHITFTLTLDVYGDHIPEEDGGARNALPEPIAPGTSDARTATNVVALFGRQSG